MRLWVVFFFFSFFKKNDRTISEHSVTENVPPHMMKSLFTKLWLKKKDPNSQLTKKGTLWAIFYSFIYKSGLVLCESLSPFGAAVLLKLRSKGSNVPALCRRAAISHANRTKWAANSYQHSLELCWIQPKIQRVVFCLKPAIVACYAELEHKKSFVQLCWITTTSEK